MGVLVRRRASVFVAAAVFLLSLLLYLVTLAPTITWQFSGSDSGELAAAAFTWGVAHPTGYPTWTLLGFLITRLPFGEPAWRTNLLSALCGAGTAGIASLTAMRLSARLTPLPSDGVRLVAGASAGLAFAIAPAVWSQAILTEVYPLNLLLLAILLLLLVAAPSTSRVAGLPFVAGLSLTNHLTALILVVPALALTVYRGIRARARARSYLVGLLLLLAPLCLYLLLPWRAAHHPAETWNDPRTLPRFLALVTGREYHYLLQWRDASGALTSLPAVVRLFVGQYVWWVLPLSLYGLMRTWDIDRALALVLLLSALGYAAFTSVYRAEGAEYYLLPAYLIEAVLFGAGLAGATMELVHWRPLAQSSPATLLALLLLLAAFTILPRAVLEFPSLNLRHDYAARDYARSTLAAAPAGARISTSRDEQTFALWYVQKVEGYRPDVQVVDLRLTGR